MWFLLVLVLVNFFQVSSVSLENFLLANGKKNVCVHSVDSVSGLAQKVVRDLFLSSEIYVSWTSQFRACSKTNFDIYTTDNSLKHIENIKSELANLKIQSSMLLVVGSSNDSLERIQASLRGYNASSLFYMGLLDEIGLTEITYHQVITFPLVQRQVIQKLNLDGNAKIIENYDLQGVEITSESLNWHPYTTYEPNGTTFGHLIDMTYYLSCMFNFTLRSTKEAHNDWGLQSEFREKFSGVLGNVIQGKVDLSLSLWIWNLQRSISVDFCIVMSDWQQFLFVPQMPQVDTTLFTRPFTNDSWIAIGMTSLVIVICSVAPMSIRKLNETSGLKLISTSGWYFFVLLNAFYGGALTMFFANEPTAPFSSIKDAVDAYPAWIIKVREGYEVSILANVSPEKQEFQTLYDRLRSDPNEYLYPTYEDVLQEATTNQVVFHTFARPLIAFLKENPQFKSNLKVFARQRPQPLGIIFPKNSPLVPIFNLGIRRMKESGVMNFLANKWEGSFREERFQVNVMVLNGGQVIMVYILMGMGYGLCLICLVMECAWMKSDKIKWRKMFQVAS